MILAVVHQGERLCPMVFMIEFLNPNWALNFTEFFPRGPLDNMLVQIMAWHRTGAKPVSELVMI